MRHKYDTRAIVLGRVHVGEATSLIALLTQELGLVFARAQSVRRSGAKLAPALATLAESDVVLVRGKQEWRIAGAVLRESWYARFSYAAREHSRQMVGLTLRLVTGESREPELFTIVSSYISALSELPIELLETAEMLSTFRMLTVLGFAERDPTIGAIDDYTPAFLSSIARDHARITTRITTGLAASGL